FRLRGESRPADTSPRSGRVERPLKLLEQLEDRRADDEAPDTVPHHGHSAFESEDRVLEGAVERREKAGSGEIRVVEPGDLVLGDDLVVEALEPDDVLDVQAVRDRREKGLLGPQAPALEAVDGVAREGPELVPGEAVEVAAVEVLELHVELAEAAEVLVLRE